MMQGDSYSLAVEILKADKTVLTPEEVSDVEISVGPLHKTYKKKQVVFDSENEKWKVLLTQKETFGFLPARVKLQLRVAWSNGDVEGCSLGTILIEESISKEVL